MSKIEGFFSKAQVEDIPYKSEKGYHSCVSCGLYKDSNSPKMQPQGGFKKRIMVIGEALGKAEDDKGIMWAGASGKKLNAFYNKMGISLEDDCISLKAVNCCIREGLPTEHEIACCRAKVITAVKKHKPRVIILHGNSAVNSLLGYKWKKDLGGIMKWRGWFIPDREFNCWICPTFHPTMLEKMRERDSREVDMLLLWDLQKAFSLAETPFPTFKEDIRFSDDINGVLTKYIDDKRDFAFDIETTGLKPYNKAIHKIPAISFCNNEEYAHAIKAPEKEKDIKLLNKLMRHPKIGKIAANMKFEDTWLKVLWDITVRPWVFDTMQAGHILDNRPGITGLKFQSFVRFGLAGYDDDIAEYLKSPDNATPNRIMELTENRQSYQKLLLYNGMDSLLTYRLAQIQMKELGII